MKKKINDVSKYKNDLDITIQNVINIDKLKNSSILITGSTGLIGSFLADTLIKYNIDYNANITIYLSGRNISRLNDRFKYYDNYNLIKLEYDVNHIPKFNYKFDYIIHAASNANPSAYNLDPVGTILSNVIGTRNLLDYGKENKCKRLLYVSSGEIYGNSNNDIDDYKEDCCGEIDSTNPRSCYPNSKRLAETLCVSYSKQYNLDTVIVRPSHIYGPNYTEKDNRVSAQFFKDVLDNKDIVMKSKGLQERNYCYIADATSGILSVMINGKLGEAYNVANKNSIVTIAEFANKIANYAGKNVKYEIPNKIDIAQRSFIRRQVLNTEKIENLGWRPMYDIDKGILNTLEILREI